MAECNNIDDFKLIKLYEERPLLWDNRLSEYYAASSILFLIYVATGLTPCVCMPAAASNVTVFMPINCNFAAFCSSITPYDITS